MTPEPQQPPFQAGAIALFALLSFEHAFVLWTLINVVLIGLLPLILMPCVPLLARKPYLGLLAFCFPPMLIAFVLGQDAPLLPVVIGTSYLLMCRKKDVAAGLVLSIVAIKFQYLAILLPLLLFSRKFRLLAGCALGCICLAACVSLMCPAISRRDASITPGRRYCFGLGNASNVSNGVW